MAEATPTPIRVGVKLPDGRRVVLSGSSTTQIQEAAKKLAASPTSTPQPTPTAGPGLMQEIVSDLPRSIPAAVGEAVGIPLGAAGGALLTKSPSGAAVGGTLGGIGGSAAGSALGEAGKAGVQTLFGMEGAPQSLDEATSRVMDATLTGAAEGVISKGFSKGIEAARTFFIPAGGITPQAERALGWIERNLKVPLEGVFPLRGPIPLILPGQATDNQAIDIVQNIAKASLFGGRVLKAEARGEKFIQNALEDTTTSLAQRLSGEELGQLIVRSNQGKLKAANIFRDSLYDLTKEKADELGVEIPLDSLRPIHTELKRQLEATGRVGEAFRGGPFERVSKAGMKETQVTRQVPTGFTGTKPVVETIQEEVPLSLADAMALSSDLGKVARSISIQGKDDPARGTAKRLQGALQEAIETAIEDSGDPELLKLWQDARGQVKYIKNTLDTKFTRQLAQKAGFLELQPGRGRAPEIFFNGNPAAVANQMISPSATSSEISRLAKAIDPEAMKKVMGAKGAALVEAARDPATGVITGKSLLSTIVSQEEALKEGFKSTRQLNQLDRMKELAGALAIAQEKLGRGTGTVFIELSQAGAVAGLLSSGAMLLAGGDPSNTITGTGATVLLAPYLLGRAITNPKISKLLIKGTEMAPGSKAAARLVARVITEIGRLDLSPPEIAQIEREKKLLSPGPPQARGATATGGLGGVPSSPPPAGPLASPPPPL